MTFCKVCNKESENILCGECHVLCKAMKASGYDYLTLKRAMRFIGVITTVATDKSKQYKCIEEIRPNRCSCEPVDWLEGSCHICNKWRSRKELA
jgi:hypothetical protein